MFHSCAWFQSFETFQSFDELRMSSSSNDSEAKALSSYQSKDFFRLKPVEFLTVALSVSTRTIMFWAMSEGGNERMCGIW
jgi:hypothetical protein